MKEVSSPGLTTLLERHDVEPSGLSREDVTKAKVFMPNSYKPAAWRSFTKEYIATLPDNPSSGEGFYFTGKQCKRGHVTVRYADIRACAECQCSPIKKSKSNQRYRDKKKAVKSVSVFGITR